ncbi:hypothetical protein QJS04_geneDACA000380 [Acorus gramineus]|uniref:Uncharacterized protein n=1 Tax=Acorus gramineus TaxID=55184 RepID=A0AAV9AS73_ACOGR|nr:hypothetical protein QJS04_geneDACA000380 [Acorus gramineus]
MDQSEVDMFFLDKRAREAKITIPGASHVRGGRDGGASGCRSLRDRARLPRLGILVVRMTSD